MEAELTALAASGATALIGLMVGETWTHVRDRAARFFARGGDEGPAAEELDRSRREHMAAHADRDEPAEADIEAEWRTRLRRVLRANPQAAEGRDLLVELDTKSEGTHGPSAHNSISGGVQSGPVFQGQYFSGLSCRGPERVPPEVAP